VIMSKGIIKSRTDSYEAYGEYEYQLTREKVVPFLKAWGIELKELKVIDIGCGAGGSSEVFCEAGALVTGLDIDIERIDAAKSRAKERGQDIDYRVCDVHNPPSDLSNKFDLALVRDVIEHVAEPREFLSQISGLIKESGCIFISFPPYYSAFGGHQHHPESVTRFIPWCHLIPERYFYKLLPDIPAYRKELKLLNKMTISKIKKIIVENKLNLIREDYYLIRPSLNFKHNLPEIRDPFFRYIPLVRELLFTGAFYLVKPDIN